MSFRTVFTVFGFAPENIALYTAVYPKKEGPLDTNIVGKLNSVDESHVAKNRKTVSI